MKFQETPIVNRRTIKKIQKALKEIANILFSVFIHKFSLGKRDKHMTTNVRFQKQLLLDNKDTLRDDDNRSCEKNYTNSLIATIESTLMQLVNENKEFQQQVLRQLHVLNARIKEMMENQEIFIKFEESSSLQVKEIQAVTIHSE
ncbi:hypothetical protein RN001_014598 [Aquatica leii]|uniref:Uncharacterized protein n=1 Tax=Aquatica leii TaxID=1421715 RepID=A0AAN7PNL9_9COLE|nr:hypothetical protein RN001_014598 [Aquatica leii]